MFIQMMNLNVVHDHRKALDSETRREATIFLGIITYCLKDYRIHLKNKQIETCGFDEYHLTNLYHPTT